ANGRMRRCACLIELDVPGQKSACVAIAAASHNASHEASHNASHTMLMMMSFCALQKASTIEQLDNTGSDWQALSISEMVKLELAKHSEPIDENTSKTSSFCYKPKHVSGATAGLIRGGSAAIRGMSPHIGVNKSS